ncbi:MAG: 50S ribosomal protein L22 [Candidatus Hepatoplasma vulgare]|nr:MAG: 50S ribosomal protein L22 [Candidatus Hepatoplasma sp.]
MEAKASSKYVRISSKKAKLVCEIIRYKPISEAYSILEISSKKSAPLLRKVLNSAVANATQNHGMISENLYVKNAIANEGPTMKRYFPRAKGRGDVKNKRTSIIEIIVSDERKGRGKK